MKKFCEEYGHDMMSDGYGGGHNGQYYFTCADCGHTDWAARNDGWERKNKIIRDLERENFKLKNPIPNPLEFGEDSLSSIIWGDDENFEAVTDEEMEEGGRWNNYFSCVFKYIPNGKFYDISWSRGATEYQDEGPEDFSICEVVPKEVVKTVYEQVEKV